MKIFYVIQSCNNYIDSRCISSEKTWANKISQDSQYVILSKTSTRNSVYGTNSYNDDYNSLPEKWVIFFRNYDFWDFEWLFCIDDDGFVFPDRLENFILSKNFNYQDPLAIGARLCDNLMLNDTIICGGGGILLSREAVKLMINYVKDENYKIQHLCHDCFFHDLFKKLNIEVVNANTFETCTTPFVPFNVSHGCVDEHHMENSITYHYCDDKDKNFLFDKYYK